MTAPYSHRSTLQGVFFFDAPSARRQEAARAQARERRLSGASSTEPDYESEDQAFTTYWAQVEPQLQVRTCCSP